MSGSGNLSDFIMHHIVDSHEWPILPGVAIPLPHFLSLHVLMLLIGAVLTFLLALTGARRAGLLPSSPLGHVVEVLLLYIRDEVARPSIGKKDGDKWVPFLATFFFFITVLNLMGLVPLFAGATADISVTAAMSLLVFVVFNAVGIFHNGPFRYVKNLVPSGVPWWVLPILAPIEVVSIFIRAFSLTIRLFANMAAGHIMILVIAGLISILAPMISGSLHGLLGGGSDGISLLLTAPLPLAFLLFILVIKVLVCVLQAFVFTFLSSLYIGGALHQEH
ncbi:MAG TPA: F0F1 ATP synthase subunit A [Fibrobacteria bacterium]|nr:F0F1 ATP synthase subunit A [Fibrobacteria bacterium]